MAPTIDARAALDRSLELEQQQIAMTEGSRLVLRAMLREELPDAVAEGFKRVMTPETARMFSQVFIASMKEQASMRVDTWAGAAVKGFVRKVWENLWIIVFAGAFAYYVGGFAAVASLGKWAIQEALK